MTKLEYEARKGLVAGAARGGLHAAEVAKLGPMPRQATERWERARPNRGRHDDLAWRSGFPKGLIALVGRATLRDHTNSQRPGVTGLAQVQLPADTDVNCR